MGYVDRFAEMLRAKDQRFEIVAGQLFVRKAHWISPLGPVGQTFALDRAQCRGLLRKLGGGWVQWTDGFGGPAEANDWYAMVCRKFVPVEEVVSANARKNIRRGLRRCEVRQVEAREIAQNGYETYCAAVRAYGGRAPVPTAEEFARRVMSDEPFGDIRHRWAAYHEGKLIGFNQNLVYDDVEVDYTMGKYHPDYLEFYPAYALFQTMNEYYLVQRKMQYVNAGFRSISHDTEIQDFLVRLFHFEKIRVGLHVHFRPPFGGLLRATRRFRGAIQFLCPQTKPLFELDRLRTS